MGTKIHSVRELMVLAKTLRRSAAAAALPGYRDQMLRAAAELEAQISLQMTLSPADWPEEAYQLHAHSEIDLTV